MRANYTLLILAVAVAPRAASADTTAGAPASEPPPAAATEAGSTWTFGIEPQFGVLVPTSKLGTYVTGGLEIDYAIGQLVIGADVAFTQPSYSSTVMDMRVPGGQATYTIRQSELMTGLLASYRFGSSQLVPHVGGGPILQMLRSKETTSLAPETTTSQQTKFGIQLAGGVDYHAGPGFLVGDLRLIYSSLDTLLTGSSNAGSISLLAGYRLAF